MCKARHGRILVWAELVEPIEQRALGHAHQGRTR